MSKKVIKKPFSNPFRAAAAVGTFGTSEVALQGGKALAKKVGLIQGQPDVPGLPPAPDTTGTLDQAADDEELKRKRRANIATRPLGVLVQQALQTRTLTGQ